MAAGSVTAVCAVVIAVLSLGVSIEARSAREHNHQSVRPLRFCVLVHKSVASFDAWPRQASKPRARRALILEVVVSGHYGHPRKHGDFTPFPGRVRTTRVVLPVGVARGPTDMLAGS